MNTDDVYFGKLYTTSSIEDTYFSRIINYSYKRDVLVVLKQNIFGKRYIKDLNTGKRHNVKLSNKIGELHVSISSLVKFNDVVENQEKKLPKSKILKLGNKYIKK